MRVRWTAAFSVSGLLLVGPAAEQAGAQSPSFDYFSVSPCRVLDTRVGGQGPALTSGTSRIVTVTGGSCAIPTDARAIAANIAAVSPSGAGNIRLYPGDGALPPTSALNFSAGQTRANNGIFPLAESGNGTLAIRATIGAGGTVHAVLDVTGYFAVPPCVPSACPGTDTECRTRTCQAGVCGFDFQPAGTVTTNQTPEDCQQNQCDGTGGIESVPDDTDLPNDGQQCTDDLCSAGDPVHPPSPAGNACDQGGLFCDGTGRCVACLAASDCPGSDTECQVRTCTDGACGFTFQPSTTTCTGASQGGICDATDHCTGSADTCVDEFQPNSFLCRATEGQCDVAEFCTGIAGACPANGFAPAGTACGEGGFCDGAGTCVTP